jgi:hypothetical protein
VQAAAGAGGLWQHGPRRGQHLLGGQPADRRAGRGEGLRRAGRGVVRPAVGGGVAAAAGPGQAPGRVPARDRLAGPQAGGVRRLPLPGGPVPVQRVPPGLRRPVPAAAGEGGEGVPGHPAPGGPAGRGGRGGGVGVAFGRGPAAERGGRGGGTGEE